MTRPSGRAIACAAWLAIAVIGCDEDIQLIPPIGPECEVCDDGACTPLPDGTACSGGVCEAAECVADDACASGERFVAVAAGEHHTCALGFGGAMYCWGGNENGQLGLGDFADRLAPAPIVGFDDWEDVALGWRHSCGLRRDNTAWCWGRNSEGQVGVEFIYQVPTPTQVQGGAAAWSQLALGSAHTCGVGPAGDLWCWGRNEGGELGVGGGGEESAAPLAVLDPPPNWRDVTAGEFYTCAVDWDGGAWCWGRNENGVLGVSSIEQSPVPRQLDTPAEWIEVEGGGRHACAEDTAGELWCWGRNTDGQLGIDDTGESTPTPVRVGRFPTAALGERHSCAIAPDGILRCWGSNDSGQLGAGDIADRLVPTQIGSSADWADVTAGQGHTCALRNDGALFCWGLNEQGQLGVGDRAPRLRPSLVCPPADT